ncbi:hypothetical protein D187_004162 [Cystobacter fuscus DSM 2262]|uniref:Uncharacterized protein n=1 Tax=Cystobacter fuscus (strain ATCC 25194 / DSM 2262 / NBRC 100088 / M29) TaxID=1242864 RepID=S9P5B8_CYSF2|nr:DUF1800 domain-containing protein [Cystobacter fuscus]EPX58406.1 hypothetical protein D187_004162 [Cystobacter fuscus DSM 2262]
MSRALLLSLLGLLTLPGCASGPWERATTPPRLTWPATGWSADKQALHVLRRLAFGPSPRDWEEVRRVGVASWVERQLWPERIPDEAVERQLATLPTVTFGMKALRERYPLLQDHARELGIRLETQEDRDRLTEMLGADMLPGRVDQELRTQKLLRAVDGQRQLQEVLVDFWFNHFNVSVDKGPVRWMVMSFERDALRPHVFGRFRELLAATARHPAMLFYLDNWRSAGEGPAPGKGGGKKKASTGLNENYARELLELHTLGVDGGYSQQDVREVARAFTGWTIDEPDRAPVFVFQPDMHDAGDKHVLGVALPAGGGQEDGERVLDILARHPATARFIATKLARKFVSEAPPPALVERLAQVFLRTEGDLRAVYSALFTSPEFWSDEALGALTKTPLELVVSSLRALGARTDGGPALSRVVERMGQSLYRAPAPTGFPEHAAPWVNTGALVQRINFALDLTEGRVRGTRVEFPWGWASPPANVAALLDSLVPRLLFEPLSAETRATLLSALAPDSMPDGEMRPLDVRRAAGLLLGSPEFQKQ